MDALILSCSTGGGHDSAALAITEALEQRGDHAVMMNPYRLRSDKTAQTIDLGYIRMVQKCPRLFGAAYCLGNQYRKLPVHSPVYHCNRAMVNRMEQHLRQNHCDVVICTHLFPAEILTQMRNQQLSVPKTIFVATDYTCIPFTEETDMDAYVIPTEKHRLEYTARHIPAEKLHPLGIPVRAAFLAKLTRQAAKEKLNLALDKRYLLLCGGSMGAGKLADVAGQLLQHKPDDTELIAICGNNEALYTLMERRYAGQMILLRRTEDMPLYLRACDVYLTKPGGLSSTEAAAMGVPLIHLPPIPGCEAVNAGFFARNGMSIRLDDHPAAAVKALDLLNDQAACQRMIDCQRQIIPAEAARRISDLAHQLTDA